MERFRNEEPYNPYAGPWPVEYSEEEKAQQREAGQELLQRFKDTLSRGEHAYAIPKGVYRIDTAFLLEQYDGMHFWADHAELIFEGKNSHPHFRFDGAKNVKITGKLLLDADPIGFTQGTITDNDFKDKGLSTVTLQLHPNYPVPKKGERIVCFNPETGVMIPQHQVRTCDVEDLGNGLVRVSYEEYYATLYGLEFRNAHAVGNFICLENISCEDSQGGISMNNTTNVEIEDVEMHAYCLIFGMPLYGDYSLRRLRCCRRPGTNRLMGGGHPQFQVYGGSCRFEDCEIAHNFDDLTNIGSEVAFAWNQVAPNQAYLAVRTSPIEPGKHFTFYNAYTMEKSGEAGIVDSVRNEDEGINQGFWDALKAAQNLTWDIVPHLVTFDRDIDFPELQIADCKETRPSSFTFENCYLHDSLAAGISLKGPNEAYVNKCVVQRAGLRAITAGCEPYWWEGAIPANVTFTNNLVLDSPSNLPEENAAMLVYTEAVGDQTRATGSPVVNVRIADNKVVNSRLAGIGVRLATNVEISNNVVENPMTAGFNTQYGGCSNYRNVAAIYLDAVANIKVSNNHVELVHPELVPEIIKASSNTDKGQIRLEHNSVNFPGGEGEPIPNTFYTKLSSWETGTMEGQWDKRDFGRCYEDRMYECRQTGAKATFTWHGTRARVYGMRWKSMGPLDFSVDGGEKVQVDCGELPSHFESFIKDDVLPDQILFDSGILTRGDHSIVLEVKDSLGPGKGLGCGIEAFDYIDDEGTQQCQTAEEQCALQQDEEGTCSPN